VDACINGCQYEILEFLLKGSRRDSLESSRYQRYVLSEKLSKKDIEYYWESRIGRDQAGNNPCHSLFNMPDSKMRYAFLRLLL
jgi:hypothetical protein